MPMTGKHQLKPDQRAHRGQAGNRWLETGNNGLQPFEGGGDMTAIPPRPLLIEDPEDETHFRNYFSKAPGMRWSTVLSARGAKEALVLFRGEKGDFSRVFCEVVIPDRNGPEHGGDFRGRKPDVRILMNSG
jgi:hypothetical protein